MFQDCKEERWKVYLRLEREFQMFRLFKKSSRGAEAMGKLFGVCTLFLKHVVCVTGKDLGYRREDLEEVLGI